MRFVANLNILIVFFVHKTVSNPFEAHPRDLQEPHFENTESEYPLNDEYLSNIEYPEEGEYNDEFSGNDNYLKNAQYFKEYGERPENDEYSKNTECSKNGESANDAYSENDGYPKNGTSTFPVMKDVSFEFYSRDHQKGLIITSESDLRKYVNISKPTKLITHGFNSNSTSPVCKTIRNGFLYKYDANIFVMNWGPIALHYWYPYPLRRSPQVGKHLAKFLNFLVDEIEVNPGDIHIVSHSLGAHMVGWAAREVFKKGKIGRITGLDPTSAGFSGIFKPYTTLCKNDANFVDVYHTCPGIMGVTLPLGHADFYVIGYGPERGCSVFQYSRCCQHSEAWGIFASSLVLYEPYIATRCSALEDVKKQMPCSAIKAVVGDPISSDSRGIYYMNMIFEADLVPEKNTSSLDIV